MKILVPGATGAVGKNVVEQALARGHEVVAIARTPAALTIEHPKLTKAKVDILDAAAVVPLLEDVDAVVSTVGIGASKEPTVLYSAGTKNVMTAWMLTA